MAPFFRNLGISYSIFILSFCGKEMEYEIPTLFAKGYQVENSFPIQEILIRSRVVRGSRKNEYSLVFDSKYKNQLLAYKPSKIQLNLPYLNAPSFFVSITYKDAQILSSFHFPEGWIDSAELDGYFYIKNSQGWSVPINVIYSPLGENQYVIKLSNGRVSTLQVNVIEVANDQAIIMGKLEKGDILISSRQSEMIDGMTVKVNL
ncbi:hypothetical protein [Leptospira ognonensis]|nr:hypothetical protein [Leptospira ognonensis]